ncbi:hypothetical protein GINT2_001828 [Glugoides intestinalis]
MRIYKCWFCSASIYPGHGTTFVRSDCTVFRFCRPKCFRLFKRRLNPRKIKWTKISRKLANKELIDDPIMQFERRVDVPEIYSREVLLQTIDAIPKIVAIRQRREDLFIANRILSGQEKLKENDLLFIEKNKRLLDKESIVACTVKREIAQKKEKEVQYN